MPAASFRAAIRVIPVIGTLLFVAAESRAQAFLPPGFTDEMVVSGFRYSPSMAWLPDDRILVVEKYDARIRLVVNGVLLPMPIAVIDSVRHTPESGLLGIALDPGWPARPYVYAHYNHVGAPYIHIARYTAVGDLEFTGNGHFTIDPASRHLVLADLPDDQTIHNGGNVRFGPDGMLYVSLGDDSNPCRAVLKEFLQGKILRLDVSNLPPGPGGPPALADITPADNPFVADPSPWARLVWAYGLRNPYSFQVDPPTGHLVIADVGDSHWEEVDLQTTPGQNFGYPSFEGPTNTTIFCPYFEPQTSVPPIYAYDRTQFCCGAAIITSPRYRRMGGTYQFPAEYEGDVFVSDVGEGILRRAHFDGTSWDLADSVAGQPTALNWGIGMVGVTDYYLHPDGSLYYLRYAHYFQDGTGVIRRDPIRQHRRRFAHQGNPAHVRRAGSRSCLVPRHAHLHDRSNRTGPFADLRSRGAGTAPGRRCGGASCGTSQPRLGSARRHRQPGCERRLHGAPRNRRRRLGSQDPHRALTESARYSPSTRYRLEITRR
jgi:glucose/arabinose dehydrogenase